MTATESAFPETINAFLQQNRPETDLGSQITAILLPT
jgi:hypothetical protein